jgi:hypothetical protein
MRLTLAEEKQLLVEENERLRAQYAGIKCRFGCEEVIGLFHVPDGCHCWPDPVQALCGQHAITIESAGPITLIAGKWPENPSLEQGKK